jgi:hypothetical protein
MICPVCESEYQPGIKRCRDDGAELVERLAPDINARGRREARFVPLPVFGSPISAEMVNDILRQNGIRSFLRSGGDDAFSPLFSTATPGAAVLVDERDLPRALEIYNAFFGPDVSPLGGATEEDLNEK